MKDQKVEVLKVSNGLPPKSPIRSRSSMGSGTPRKDSIYCENVSSKSKENRRSRRERKSASLRSSQVSASERATSDEKKDDWVKAMGNIDMPLKLKEISGQVSMNNQASSQLETPNDSQFTFQNEAGEVAQQANTRAQFQFLQTVAIQSSSDSQYITDEKQESEPYGHDIGLSSLNYGPQQLGVIEEDAQEIYGSIASNMDSSRIQEQNLNQENGATQNSSEKSKESENRVINLITFQNNQNKQLSAVEVLNSHSINDQSDYMEANREWADKIMAGGISGSVTPDGTIHSERNNQAYGDSRQLIAKQIQTSRTQKPGHTNAENSSRTNSGQNKYQKSSQQDYVQIFQSLLQQAISAQSKIEDLPADNKIDPDCTKSFKDLCLKLLDDQSVIVHQNQHHKEQTQKLRTQMQELYESHLQEQLLQDQIHDVQLQEISQSYKQQIVSIKQLHQVYVSNQDGQMKKEQGKAKEKEQMLEKKVQDIMKEPCKICVSHEHTMKELNSEFTNLQDKMAKTEQLYKQLLQKQTKEDHLLQENHSLKSKNSSLQEQIQHCQSSLNEMVNTSKDSTQTNISIQKQFQNLSMMYNISKETLTQQVNEIEELKVSLQDQIKENLRLEVKKKEEHEQAIRRFDNQEKIFEEIKKQSDNLKSQNSEYKSQLDQLSRQYQEALKNQQKNNNVILKSQLEDLKMQVDQKQQSNELMNNQVLELQRQEASLNKLLASKDIEIGVINQQKDKLIESENALNSIVGKTGRELQEKSKMIEEFKNEVQGMAGIDIQFTVQRDNQGSIYSNQNQQQNTRREGRIQKTMNYLNGEQSVKDQGTSFLEMTPSVHSYVQGIGQTRIIDKFLKNDQLQKKEIKQLKHSYEKLEQELSVKMESTSNMINKIQEEKISLERLILEILSFGEQCDKQFDYLQGHFQQFEGRDREHTDKIESAYRNIKINLQDSLKELIVDLADSKLRDDLLSLLQQLNEKDISLEKINNQIMHKLTMKMKQLQNLSQEQEGQTKQLKQQNEHFLEIENEKNQAEGQLKENQEQILQHRGLLLELNNYIQGILKQIQQTEQNLQEQSQIHGDELGSQWSSYMDTKDAEKKNKDNLTIEEIRDEMCYELRLINDWSVEQSNQVESFLKDRARIVQLNLQNNDLAKTNSLLKIDNDKQANIIGKFKDQNFPRAQAITPVKQFQETRVQTEKSRERSHSSHRFQEPIHAVQFKQTQVTEPQLGVQNIRQNTHPDMPLERNFSQSSEGNHSKIKSSQKATSEQKETLLHNILNKVSNLRMEFQQEVDPRVSYGDFKHIEKSPKTKSKRDQEDQSNWDCDLPGSNKKRRSAGSSQKSECPSSILKQKQHKPQYFDQRGSVDLIRSKSERNKVKFQNQIQPKRCVTPQLVSASLLQNLNKTCQDDQLQSYRDTARSRDNGLQRTSQFMSQFAQTHQNVDYNPNRHLDQSEIIQKSSRVISHAINESMKSNEFHRNDQMPLQMQEDNLQSFRQQPYQDPDQLQFRTIQTQDESLNKSLFHESQQSTLQQQNDGILYPNQYQHFGLQPETVAQTTGLDSFNNQIQQQNLQQNIGMQQSLTDSSFQSENAAQMQNQKIDRITSLLRNQEMLLQKAGIQQTSSQKALYPQMLNLSSSDRSRKNQHVQHPNFIRNQSQPCILKKPQTQRQQSGHNQSSQMTENLDYYTANSFLDPSNTYTYRGERPDFSNIIDQQSVDMDALEFDPQSDRPINYSKVNNSLPFNNHNTQRNNLQNPPQQYHQVRQITQPIDLQTHTSPDHLLHHVRSATNFQQMTNQQNNQQSNRMMSRKKSLPSVNGHYYPDLNLNFSYTGAIEGLVNNSMNMESTQNQQQQVAPVAEVNKMYFQNQICPPQMLQQQYNTQLMQIDRASNYAHHS